MSILMTEAKLDLRKVVIVSTRASDWGGIISVCSINYNVDKLS